MQNVELKGFRKLRGLNVLLETDKNITHVQTELVHLPVSSLQPGKYQPRRKIDGNDKFFLELIASIKSHGIIQPLIVRKMLDSKFEIVAGERRWRAAQAASLDKVPALIRDIDDNTALAYALIENIQRQDLNPIEEALALKKLIEEFSMTHEEVAESIGRSRAMVSNTLRLLNLADPIKEMLSSNKLDMGHARALLTLPISQQIEVADIISTKQMTVRATEAYVRFLQRNPEKTRKEAAYDSIIVSLEEELLELLGIKTKINVNVGGKGKMICYFENLEAIKNLIENLRR